jgi:N utilization substance protein B
VRRTEQRRAAVWALYQSDLLGKPLDDTFGRDAHAFTRALAHATQDRQPELDELHPDAVPGEEPIPAEGAIDEAVETAKRFCGAEAPGFVNGILGAVLRERREAPPDTG